MNPVNFVGKKVIVSIDEFNSGGLLEGVAQLVCAVQKNVPDEGGDLRGYECSIELAPNDEIAKCVLTMVPRYVGDDLTNAAVARSVIAGVHLRDREGNILGRAIAYVTLQPSENGA